MAVSVNDGSLQWVASIDTSQFNKQIAEINSQIAGVAKTSTEEANAIDNLMKKTVGAIAAYATFAAGTNFIGDIIKVRGEFQQLEVAFETMLGSKQKADQLLREITEFAATTPFELKDVAGATKQLLAFGIQAEDINGTLRSLGDVSAGIGAPLGEIAYLFGTIKTQGVAMTQDVRQFAQRGIPIYQELAKVLEVNVEQVGDLITAGKVGFPEIEKVFKNLTAEGSQFGGLMEAQSQTLLGQISNLRDAFDQMLNDIGRSGEGIFADAISGVKYLVDNYQTIIDTLKVLIITYGSYRAAIIATNAVTALSTSLTKGWTIAEMLRYRAMVISEKAMKLLNATLLKNPAGFVIAGLTGIITALTLFGKRSSEAKSKSELLAQAQERVGESLAEIEGKIRPYVDALKNANLSEEQRLDIYNKLKAIDPAIVEGLDAKTLSYTNLSAKVDAYVNSLRKQYQLEANKDAVSESIKAEQNLQKEIDNKRKKQEQLIKQIDKLRKRGAGTEEIGLLQFDVQRLSTDINAVNSDLREQQKTTEEFGKTVVETEGEKKEAKARTVAVIEEEIKLTKQQQSQFSSNSQQYQDYQRKINALEDERRKITGASTKELKSQQSEENKLLALLEKRKAALEDIQALERDALQSGLLEDASEIDKINERREKGLQLLAETNKEIEKYNKNNKKNVELLGEAEINRINKAADTLIKNTQYKQDAEDYLKAIKEKQSAFQDFQKLQESGNQLLIDQARDSNKEQLGDYKNYIDLLQDEYDKLYLSLKFDGTDDIGTKKRFEGIKKILQEVNKDFANDEAKASSERFERLLQQTESFRDQELAINNKYSKLEKTLQDESSRFSPEQVAAMKAALEQSRKDEITALENDTIRKSELYRKLNQDILAFSRDRLKKEKKLLEERLKTDTKLTPQQKADIQGVIDQYDGLLDETNEIAKQFAKLSGGFFGAGDAFSELASSLSGINDELADVLSTMSSIANVAGNAASAIGSFASGDIAGGIQSTIKTITGIFSIGKAVKESKRVAKAEIDEFYRAMQEAELQLSQIERERAREQALNQETRLEGLHAELSLLKKQKKEVEDQYDLILKKIQEQQFIAGKTTEKSGGFLGIGRKTKAVDILETIGGKSFEELEELFISGRLTESAKALFEQLKQIRDEGVDIDKMLEENKREAREIFTGTTADSIIDSIAEGFASGERSAADFADNFTDLMRGAMISSLKFKYLEGPLNKFFEDFAAAAESGGVLDNPEIERLQATYDSILENAATQFDQLQQIAGLNINGSASDQNNLRGAIKGMSEQQADLLAGQFGGLRVTASEQLKTAIRGLEVLQNIEFNTFRLHELRDIFRRLELDGIKIK